MSWIEQVSHLLESVLVIVPVLNNPWFFFYVCSDFSPWLIFILMLARLEGNFVQKIARYVIIELH